MSLRGRSFGPLLARLAVAGLCALVPQRVLSEPLPAAPHDPLVPLLRRMDRYFQRHEVDGVTMDSRYDVNPSEAIRMSVVSQLLGYAELYQVRPTRRLGLDIAERADYLLAHLEPIRSHTPFDGMLGCSLVAAYEVTGEPRHLAAATVLLDELKAIPTWECVLNGGLMVAMATAEWGRLTGDAVALQKTHDILSMLPAYQHEDGSFPHWCVGSRDIHYSGWMAMELNLIQRTDPDPLIAPMLDHLHAFFEDRVDSTGRSHYEAPCPNQPGCVQYYYSRATGCEIDYDTRAWTVEPGYTALLFDRYGSAKYPAVMDFLLTLEDRGTFADKWDYIPTADDPEYVWSIADTSVANMSIIFWSLAAALNGRPDRAASAAAWGPEAGDDELGGSPVGGTPPLAVAVSSAPRALEIGPILPNPARSACAVRYATPVSSTVSLTLYDALGRRIRELFAGSLDAGHHEARWDGRDLRGNRSPSGIYFVRLRLGASVRTARLLFIR